MHFYNTFPHRTFGSTDTGTNNTTMLFAYLLIFCTTISKAEFSTNFTTLMQANWATHNAAFSATFSAAHHHVSCSVLRNDRLSVYVCF